jgi:glycine cleavage system T protein
MIQRSTLYTMQEALGATFTEVAGWQMPEHFGDPQAEYRAVRQSVGLCDLSHRGLVRVTGTDRQRFLHAMVSNDTASLQPGQGCYATLLTNKGKLVADFVVHADTDAYLLDLEPQMALPFIDAISQFVIADDVTFDNVSAQWGRLSLQGPRAAELLTYAFERQVPDLARYAFTAWDLAAYRVYLIRRSHTGEQGYQLLAPAQALPDLWEVLWQHREMCNAHAVGLDALEVLRIEAGIPLYGRELTEETIPVEANLLDAISYTKGCYIGQEVIARIDARGHVNRRLVGLVLDGETLPPQGASVVSPERAVGWVTSATHSPALQQNIALGYVRREVLSPGTQLEVRANGTTVGATVVELPFYQSKSA